MKNKSITSILLAVTIGALLSINAARAGSLSGALTQLSSDAVNLTAKGTIDWVHWGLGTPTGLNRKARVTAQISNFTVIDLNATKAKVERYDNSWNGYRWTDGTPRTSASTADGLYIIGEGTGFQIKVPADTTLKTLKVYVGSYNSQMHFEAALSDDSAPMFVDEGYGNVNDGPNREVTLNFAANSAGQTLTVRFWTLISQGDSQNVTLQAAALTEAAPLVQVSRPVSGTIFCPASGGLEFSAANQPPLSIPETSVRLLLNGQDVSAGLAISGTANARTATYSGLKVNQFYTAECIAADNTGRASTNVIRFDTFAFNDPNAVIIENEDYNYGDGTTNGLFLDPIDVVQFSGFIGTPGVDFLVANPANGGYRSDGVLLNGATVDQVHGSAQDFFIEGTSPNDWFNYTRTFPGGRYNVYVRYATQVAPSTIKLGRVTSNPGQANQTVSPIATLNLPNNNDDNFFRYAALTNASGEPLSLNLSGVQTLRWTRADTQQTAKLRLNYFVLTRVGEAMAQAPTATIGASGNNIQISFPTEVGFTYTVQFKNQVGETAWQSIVPAIPGDGSTKTVSQPVSDPARFYRVHVQ